MTYTTIDDVVFSLREADPGFDELDTETLRGIVRDNKSGRYEDITHAELDEMVIAAYEALGIERKDAERIVYA